MDAQIRFLTRTALLIALTMVIQLIRFPQLITGTGVNLFLYLSVFLVGIGSGCTIGLITPIIALSLGIMGFAPLIPYIIIGNLSLAIIFGLLKKINRYLAVAAASVAKFLILAGAVRFIVEVPPKAAQMMQLPQLFTALAGGVLALILAHLLKRTNLFPQIKEPS